MFRKFRCVDEIYEGNLFTEEDSIYDTHTYTNPTGRLETTGMSLSVIFVALKQLEKDDEGEAHDRGEISYRSGLDGFHAHERHETPRPCV